MAQPQVAGDGTDALHDQARGTTLPTWTRQNSKPPLASPRLAEPDPPRVGELGGGARVERRDVLLGRVEAEAEDRFGLLRRGELELTGVGLRLPHSTQAVRRTCAVAFSPFSGPPLSHAVMTRAVRYPGLTPPVGQAHVNNKPANRHK